MIAPLTHRLVTILAFVLAAAAPSRAADMFRLDQRYGTIEFTAQHFGAFASHGQFEKFTGLIGVDRTHPENTTIDIQVDADSVTIPWQDGADLLRGPDFFDAAHHRMIHFTGDRIVGLDPTHFRIVGTLEMRGVSHPLTLDATLERRWRDDAKAVEVADFNVRGVLSRADYGMTADPVMISNSIQLSIMARVALPIRPR
jgi:polyisoprenoid-binding protein YceI